MTLKLGMKHCLCEYYQGCSNYDLWLTLTYFTSRSNLVTLAFVWEKVIFVFGNYCSLRSQSRLKHSAKWVNEVDWVSEVKVILWTWPKVIQISKLNVWLWPVYSGERFRASWPSCCWVCLRWARHSCYNFSLVYMHCACVPWSGS